MRSPELTPGVTIEDTIELAKTVDGTIDILQIRGSFIDPSQPTYLNPNRLPHREATARITKALHEAGIGTKVTLVGGCQDPALLDKIIAEGEADFIGSARGFISDADWPEKALRGYEDEIVPCLRCNKCHQAHRDDWNSVCSVNPEFGIEHRVHRMVSEFPKEKKKVAVIGGGPAGLKAAMGQCRSRSRCNYSLKKRAISADFYRRPVNRLLSGTVKEFSDYQIHMVEKQPNITVKLETEATPELIRGMDFDVVVSAIGAEPFIPSSTRYRQSKCCYSH